MKLEVSVTGLNLNIAEREDRGISHDRHYNVGFFSDARKCK